MLTFSLASAAQVGLPGTAEVVGLTHKTAQLVRQVMDGRNCAGKSCLAPKGGVGPRLSAIAGGTAYDGRQGGVWVSDGRRLALVRASPVSGLGACDLLCPALPAPLPPTPTIATMVTGLTFVEAGKMPKPGIPAARGMLLLSYSTGHVGAVELKGCTLGKPLFCNLGTVLGSRRTIGALAADDGGGLLFIGTSSPTSTSPSNLVYIVRLDQPCAVLCKFTIVVNQLLCPKLRLGPITGMTFDGCTDTLFITDGTSTVYGRLSVIRQPTGAYTCSFRHQGCCPGSTEEYTGLALLPKPSRSVGQSCTRASCYGCQGIAVGTVGQAVLGNSDFAVTLTAAPSNYNMAVLALGIGPCGDKGFSLGFCEAVRVALVPVPPILVFFGSPPVTPRPPCNGRLPVPLPLPVQPILCKLNLSAQWLVLCSGLPRGNGVTSCLTIPLSAN